MMYGPGRSQSVSPAERETVEGVIDRQLCAEEAEQREQGADDGYAQPERAGRGRSGIRALPGRSQRNQRASRIRG